MPTCKTTGAVALFERLRSTLQVWKRGKKEEYIYKYFHFENRLQQRKLHNNSYEEQDRKELILLAIRQSRR